MREDIAWQVEVIRQNTAAVSRSDGSAPAAAKGSRVLRSGAAIAPREESFLAEADKIAAELSRIAIRQGPGAAWIGLDWLGDSEVVQLVPLGADLYNGLSGIALFLAAHAAMTGSKSSRELALAAVAHLRKSLKGRNAARMARSLGTGGATGLGSIVYALAVMAKCLRDDDLLADAHAAAELFSDDLIAADKQLDVIGGQRRGDPRPAAALSRQSSLRDVLASAPSAAITCWRSPASERRAEAGSGKAAASKRSTACRMARRALPMRWRRWRRRPGATNSPTRRRNASHSRTRAMTRSATTGRISAAMRERSGHASGVTALPASGSRAPPVQSAAALDAALLAGDVGNALAGVERGWPGHIDTLCCGTLGSIEFFCEAADALGRGDLREHASRRMAAVMENAAASGDYRWNVGKRQFNLGLFRGLAGVGYTLLRRVDSSLPNVLIWE